MARTLDPKVFKRISWIANCGGVTAFNVITFDDWRTNNFKVFLEVTSVAVWFQQAGSWFWRSVDLVPPACYYLGQFQWYWDYDIGEGLPPTSPRMGNILPWPYAPSVTTGEYLPLQIYTRDDIVLFHGQNALTNIDKQQAFIAKRNQARGSCMTANYPTKPPRPQRPLLIEDQPMDWPGTPIEEMTPPTPDAPPTPPEQAPPGSTIVRLTMYYGETPPSRADGLELSIQL